MPPIVRGSSLPKRPDLEDLIFFWLMFGGESSSERQSGQFRGANVLAQPPWSLIPSKLHWLTAATLFHAADHFWKGTTAAGALCLADCKSPLKSYSSARIIVP